LLLPVTGLLLPISRLLLPVARLLLAIGRLLALLRIATLLRRRFFTLFGASSDERNEGSSH
jgi:hypothetical protein